MSSEAVRFVFENAVCSGSDLTVVLAIAHLSKHRKAPYWSSASYAEISTLARISKRWTKEIIETLIARHELAIVTEGGGSRKNLYDILPWVVRNPDAGVVRNTSPLYREDRKSEPRAGGLNSEGAKIL